MFAFISSVIMIVAGIFAFALRSGPSRTTAFVVFIIALIAFVIFLKNNDNF